MPTVASREARGARLLVIAVCLILAWCGSSSAEAEFVEKHKWGSPGSWRFGVNTALSNDGDVALVRSYGEGAGNCPTVFRRNPATNAWNPEVIQHPPSCSDDVLLALLSGNGDVVVVMASTAQTQYVRSYVFNGAAWEIEHTLEHTYTSDSLAGVHDGALSDDGSTLILTSYDYLLEHTVFKVLSRSAAGWSLAHTVVQPGDAIPFSVAASGDTQRVAIGVTESGGTVYLWHRTGSSWVLEATLTGPPSGIAFGRDVALSADGSVALIDQANHNCPGQPPFQCGAIHVYVRQGSAWFWQQELLPDGGKEKGYGAGFDPGYLSLSSSGGLAVVGSASTSCAFSQACGSVHLFRRQGLAWHHEQTLLSTTGPFKGYLYGRFVAVSGDAGTVLVGAPHHACPAGSAKPDCGAAFLYTFDPKPPGGCVGPQIDPDCFEILVPSYGQPFVPIGCEIVDCCPLCPALALVEIEWVMKLDGARIDELVLRFERLDRDQLSRLRLRGPAQWLGPGLLRIQPGDEVVISGFTRPRDELRWSPASPRMTFHSVVAADPRQPAIPDAAVRLRVEQRTSAGTLSESTLVYRLGPRAP